MMKAGGGTDCEYTSSDAGIVDRADSRVVIGLTVESLPTWPAADCNAVFAWTTHRREVEFSILQ